MPEPQPQPEVTAAARAFVAAIHPPETAPRAALWFAFRGDRLLVRSVGERAELLDYAELAALGADFEAGHYLGRLDDLDCYALALDDTLEVPSETSCCGIRRIVSAAAAVNPRSMLPRSGPSCVRGVDCSASRASARP